MLLANNTKRYAVAVGAYIFFGATLCQAADTQANEPDPSTSSTPAQKGDTFEIKPVLIDSDKNQSGSSSTSLGIDYKYQKNWNFWESHHNTPPPPGTYATSGQVEVKADGTVASSADKNPNKLLEFSASGLFKADNLDNAFRGGFQLSYETDQSRENKQTVYAFKGQYSRYIQGYFVDFLAHYGTVDPKGDTERQKLIGQLDSYKRGDIQLFLTSPYINKEIRNVELNLRYYKETSPPDAIRIAGQDVHKFGFLRFNLPSQFFVMYSFGSLPFDVQNAHAIKIGWSGKLQ